MSISSALNMNWTTIRKALSTGMLNENESCPKLGVSIDIGDTFCHHIYTRTIYQNLESTSQDSRINTLVFILRSQDENLTLKPGIRNFSFFSLKYFYMLLLYSILTFNLIYSLDQVNKFVMVVVVVLHEFPHLVCWPIDPLWLLYH